jgi:HSP20 family protein
MPMDAYRHGDNFYICFDLPGVKPESIDRTVEHNVLTLTTPVHEAVKPRTIQVTSSDQKQAVTT